MRIAALEASLSSERELCGRLQQQVAAELQRGRALAAAEEGARQAEAAAAEAAAGFKKVRGTGVGDAGAAAVYGLGRMPALQRPR